MTIITILLRFLVAQVVIIEVLSSYIQPRYPHQVLHQYVIQPYTSQDPKPVPPRTPYSEYNAYYQHNYPGNYANYQYPKSETIVEPQRTFIPEIINKSPLTTDLENIPKKGPSNLDAHVLNNLAIALQLLIVNNIINNAPQDPGSVSRVLELLNSDQAIQMPNSKFLGTPNFGNDISTGILGIGSFGSSPLSLSRPGLNLMSPYDAIANNVPLSESLTSSYLAKKDFQSPYSAIMAADNNKDLFGMSDFF